MRSRYQLKSCRTFIKKLKGTTDKQEGETLLKKAYSMLDKLAKRRIVHKNNAANSKSKLAQYVHG